MREIKRHIERRQPALMRSADGRLKPADEKDIADIWAEQKRIQLKQAIDEDARRRLKRERRKEKKIFDRTSTRNAASGKTSNDREVKEIEIRLGVPKLRLPSWDQFEDFLARVEIPVFKKKRTIIALCSIALVALVFFGFTVFGDKPNSKKMAQDKSSSSVLSATQRDGKPDFSTILPAGKSIEELGGWGRVSPSGSDPVYAYGDSIQGVAITVSEQPLPNGFTSDTQAQVTSLAKQFNATRTLAVAPGAYAFIGTASQGIQSVIASKQGLLILIRSQQPIADAKWGSYIDSLQ